MISQEKCTQPTDSVNDSSKFRRSSSPRAASVDYYVLYHRPGGGYYSFTKGAPDHHPPMPPTKAMGAIKQNRPGCPTATPCSTSWCSNMIGFLRAIERQLRLIGYIFRTKFGWRGDLIPWPNRDGRAELVRLSRSKNSTVPQSTVGCLVS
jgi:hypothetical protein